MLSPDGRAGETGRLVLLADWQPTQIFVDQLRDRLLLGGLVVFGLALLGGLVFSRRVSEPLREIAAAASDIAAGNLSMELAPRGSAEAVTVARAFNDMSASLRAAQHRLMHDAIHDPLTRLPNRMLFLERLNRAISRRVRHPDYVFAVLFVDLDRFKHVNDSLGHAAGDQLLIAFSERLAATVRKDDVVSRMLASREGAPEANTLARFGGDEFVVLCEDIARAERRGRASPSASRARGREPIALGERARCSSPRASGSRIGDGRQRDRRGRCCATPTPRCTGRRRGRRPLRGVRRRDAPRRGRARCELETRPAPRARAQRVPPALPADRARSGRGEVVGLRGAGALAAPRRAACSRRRRSSRLAEETGLIVPIGAWVLARRAAQAASWQQAQRPRSRAAMISVNLSRASARPTGPGRASSRAMLDRTGAPRRRSASRSPRTR